MVEEPVNADDAGDFAAKLTEVLTRPGDREAFVNSEATGDNHVVPQAAS